MKDNDSVKSDNSGTSSLAGKSALVNKDGKFQKPQEIEDNNTTLDIADDEDKDDGQANQK